MGGLLPCCCIWNWDMGLLECGKVLECVVVHCRLICGIPLCEIVVVDVQCVFVPVPPLILLLLLLVTVDPVM